MTKLWGLLAAGGVAALLAACAPEPYPYAPSYPAPPPLQPYAGPPPIVQVEPAPAPRRKVRRHYRRRHKRFCRCQ